MHLAFIQNNTFLRKILFKLSQWKTKHVFGEIKQFLKPADRLVDIGAGTGNLCYFLHKKGFTVTPLDVKNLSFSEKIQPVIYDGIKMPFADNTFDKALIITALHHMSRPEIVLNEAKRVAKELIIIEDIYTNRLHKYLTFAIDSLLNMEFFGHPHTNKTDREWKNTFQKMGFTIIDTKYHHTFFLIHHATYFLKK